ncbi:MAG: serine/threonine protein kinase [Deltaproteobacteria bacterium]|nr:serine/threonine protein kinase [Deltaproteobacteria bacterium]
MEASQPRLPVKRMREFLASDAPTREASAARFMSGVGLAVTPISILLGPMIGWGLSALLVAVLLPFTLYELTVLWLIRRGRYAPWMPWVNVLLETSIPCAVISVDLYKQGAEYALTSPPIMVWGAVVMMSVVRASRGLSLAAGLLAACEYLIFYFGFAYPKLPEHGLVTLGPAMIAIRAFLLLCAGIGGAVLASALLRKAEEALSAVRAQDLMSKYFLHEPLGAGGMAEVFKATYCPEGGFEKTVAIKRVLPTFSNDPHFVDLFRFEAHLCSRLTHPNIVQVTDVGRFDGRYILAMEFVDGLPLHALLKAPADLLPAAAISYLGAELSAALDYLHRRTDEQGKPLQLVHRDVNPPNVLLSRIGEVKLSDFGVAHAATRQEANGDHIVGKPSYVSPEQAKHEPLDGRSDLFCLGLTLYEALTGVRVLRGATRQDIITSVFEKPVPPHQLRPDVPGDLEKLILDLLTQERDGRPATGREARARFMALEGEAAPYPHGPELLARAVEQMIAFRQGKTAEPSQTTSLDVDATVSSEPAKKAS